MSINGFPFLLFLLASVLLYYLVPLRHRWMILLAASTVFYLTFGLRPALYFIITISVTFCFSLRLASLAALRPGGETRELRRAQKQRIKKRTNRVLAIALLFNFGTLFILKYSASWIAAFDHILGTDFLVPSFLLPLGISFYIFQTSAYLIDVSKGKIKPEHNLLRYMLFAGYFPQLIQGPINSYKELAPQLFAGNRFDWNNIQRGILRMRYGILKKALIADTLAPAVEAVYSDYLDYPGIITFLGAALYCLQLYCDFSGGIDLVCGASDLFGVRMRENFRRPYFSTSLADFWRRWHISLGEWMKDYLFYPLALSSTFQRFSKWARRHLPADLAKRATPCIVTFIVFLAVGVWQGPGMANLAYGIWNGLWMSLGLLWVPTGSRLRKKIPIMQNKGIMTVFGILRTNLLVIIGRYFSRASSLMMAFSMLKHTCLHPAFSAVSVQTFSALGLTLPILLKVLASSIVLFGISLAQERGIQVDRWICSRKWYIQFPILFLALLLVIFCVYANTDYVPIAYVYENV